MPGFIRKLISLVSRNAEVLLLGPMAGAGGAVIILAIFVLANRTAWDSAVAAWVQAGAATLAMVVAVFVAAWQSHQNRELLREQANADLRRRLDTLMGLLDAANQEIWRCRRFLLRRSPGSRRDVTSLASLKLPYDDELARLDGVMATIVLYELPSWDLAQPVLLARQALAECRSVGAATYQSIESGQSAPNPLVPQIQLAKRAVLSARMVAARLLQVSLPAIVTEFPEEPPFEPTTPAPRTANAGTFA